MPEAKKKRVLVAEDERSMARALALKLESEGFEVVNAYDGQEALDALGKGKFNVMLLDLIMPEVDGFKVLEEMKAKKISVPVIVSTNLSQSEDETRARDLGAKDYFVKSNTSISDVVKHVKNAMK